MELDRDSIARRDFPHERRGYDRAAVDAHLDAVAIAVADLVATRTGSGPAGSASSVSARVESIVTAAEEAAQKIEAEARERAHEHDERVKAAAGALIDRIEALRAGVEALLAGLGEVSGRGPVAPTSGNGASEAAAAIAVAAEVEAQAEAVAKEGEARVPAEPQSQAAAPAKSGPERAAGRSTAVEDARLVALQMLLEGRSREEVDGYLAEHYDLPDRAALLDEVAEAAGA